LVTKREQKIAKPYKGIRREAMKIVNVFGSDETGCKVNGKKHWFWIWQLGN